MSESNADAEPSGRKRRDGRRALLIYMEPRLIMQLKVAALEREVTAFSIVEEAVTDWLQRQPKKEKRDKGDDQ